MADRSSSTTPPSATACRARACPSPPTRRCAWPTRSTALGIHLSRRGFPSSNPKEEALFDLLSRETFEHAEIAAFGMTRRKDVAAADDEALRVLADCFAPVCTLVGKTWSLHLEKVTRVDPEENLRMIADSVAFLRGEGKRVIYDAEHFFDAFARRRRVRAALPARGRRGRRRERDAVRHQRRHAAVARGGGRPRGWWPSWATTCQVGIHTHDDAGCGVANSLVAVEQGARLVQGTMNGYGERCGNANLVTILPDLQLKLGYDVRAAGAARAPDRDRPPRRRDLQRLAEPQPALRGRQRLRPQGRDARGGREPRLAHLRARGARTRWAPTGAC